MVPKPHKTAGTQKIGLWNPSTTFSQTISISQFVESNNNTSVKHHGQVYKFESKEQSQGETSPIETEKEGTATFTKKRQ